MVYFGNGCDDFFILRRLNTVEFNSTYGPVIDTDRFNFLYVSRTIELEAFVFDLC